MDSKRRKQQADKILYEMGLSAYLQKIGELHIIGSYKMDMMAWNDLDIDILNTRMDISKLYQLTDYITSTFHPLWYEAKEEINDQGKTVWFHGFEAMIDGEKWNFDIWFFDQETIDKAEKFCSEIMEAVKQQTGSRERIVKMKQELLRRGLYGFHKYSSMDVYKAVLEYGIYDVEELLKKYGKL